VVKKRHTSLRKERALITCFGIVVTNIRFPSKNELEKEGRDAHLRTVAGHAAHEQVLARVGLTEAVAGWPDVIDDSPF
jgi:hypothetical protein